MKTGIELIAEERQRQIEKEGWSAEHDDSHIGHELALAAVCYVMPDLIRWDIRTTIIKLWPWDIKLFKASSNDRIRELVKAGALIAAEIDRLQRIKK